MNTRSLIFVTGVFLLAPGIGHTQDRLPNFDEDKSTKEYKDRENARIEELQAQMAKETTTSSSHTTTVDVIPVIELLLSNEEAFKSTELSSEQRRKIKEVWEEYETKLQKVKDKYAHVENVDERNQLVRSEVAQLKSACITVISKELLDFQVEAIWHWLPAQIGIVKSLTDTPMGTALGLTEQQRNDLRKKADALGEKMKAEFKKFRTEANELLIDSLTPDQRQRLLRIIDPSGTMPPDDAFPGVTTHSLAYLLDYKKHEFDLDNKRIVVRGIVYDRFGQKTGEDPAEVQKRLKEEKDQDID